VRPSTLYTASRTLKESLHVLDGKTFHLPVDDAAECG